tara:strand:- start:292 stop:441 length:150 start_codon:yes stop_codon:yes gene_type:complete
MLVAIFATVIDFHLWGNLFDKNGSKIPLKSISSIIGNKIISVSILLKDK